MHFEAVFSCAVEFECGGGYIQVQLLLLSSRRLYILSVFSSTLRKAYGLKPYAHISDGLSYSLALRDHAALIYASHRYLRWTQ